MTTESLKNSKNIFYKYIGIFCIIITLVSASVIAVVFLVLRKEPNSNNQVQTSPATNPQKPSTHSEPSPTPNDPSKTTFKQNTKNSPSSSERSLTETNKDLSNSVPSSPPSELDASYKDLPSSLTPLNPYALKKETSPPALVGDNKRVGEVSADEKVKRQKVSGNRLKRKEEKWEEVHWEGEQWEEVQLEEVPQEEVPREEVPREEEQMNEVVEEEKKNKFREEPLD